MNDTQHLSISRRQALIGLTSSLLLSSAVSCARKPAGGNIAAGAAVDSPDVASVPRSCTPTTHDLRGPYWTRNDPSVVDLVKGGPLRIEGLIRGSDCAAIPGARINIWQANAAGHYNDKELRGVLQAAKDGTYAFHSVRPGNYKEPGGWRPAHIHFDVAAPGYKPVVGQLYFAGDKYLGANDSCQVCRSNDVDRIITLKDSKGRLGHQSGEFVITLAKS